MIWIIFKPKDELHLLGSPRFFYHYLLPLFYTQILLQFQGCIPLFEMFQSFGMMTFISQGMVFHILVLLPFVILLVIVFPNKLVFGCLFLLSFDWFQLGYYQLLRKEVLKKGTRNIILYRQLSIITSRLFPLLIPLIRYIFQLISSKFHAPLHQQYALP